MKRAPTQCGRHPAPERGLEEEFWRNVEAAAEALDMVFVEVAPRRSVRGAKIALAAVNLSDDAGSTEDVGEVFLQEAVLVYKEVEDFERLGAGQMVVAVFEILDQEECIESIQKYRSTDSFHRAC